ncbi:MAG: YkgJ family cysteine cluster protein [Desulfovibrionaceae bacterium]|nr:YkgJ family cysteine cluster protein [Desulfovibrionaceae bacterium]
MSARNKQRGQEGQHCRRCAVCCRRGGPALHTPDIELYRRGAIRGKHLVTFRQGELARENVQGGLIRLEAEIVKLRGISGGFACIFIEEGSSLCAIHADRPAECRALNCRDPRALTAMYRDDRISRFDLIDRQSALGELAAEHERRCSLGRLGELAARYGLDGSRVARDAILEQLRYDREMRGLMAERANLTPAELDFVFGRPLPSVLPSVGLSLAASGEIFTLIPIQPGVGDA